MSQFRPGQRQQERLDRLARRRKRQRITVSSIAASLLLIAAIIFAIWFQGYRDQQTALANKNATATTNASEKATATSITANCFINPSGPKVPAIYDSSATPEAGPSSSPALSGTPVTLADGLKYVDIKVGDGKAAAEGSNITAHYTGWLASNCTKFGSSYDSRGGTPTTPFTTTLSKDQLLPGWVEGLSGMKAGGIRRLYLPAALAYGSTGQQDQSGNYVIPPNADLIFDVSLIGVQ